MTADRPQLVLSGMQPTNTLHLGNYLGALKNWVRMQTEMPCLFCVVDMHALTQESGYAKADDVRRATREVAAAYIAAGVDPKNTPLFAQSMVKEHSDTGLDIQLRGAARLARPHDAVQGEIRQAQGACIRGPLHLPGADGGGYSCL